MVGRKRSWTRRRTEEELEEGGGEDLEEEGGGVEELEEEGGGRGRVRGRREGGLKVGGGRRGEGVGGKEVEGGGRMRRWSVGGGLHRLAVCCAMNCWLTHFCFSVFRPTPLSHRKQHSSESVIFNQPLTPDSAHMIMGGEEWEKRGDETQFA